MRIVFLFFAALFLIGAVIAQEKCELTIGDSPRLLNLKLGMNLAETNAALGGDLRVKVKPNGQRSFMRNYRKKTPKGSLRGIRALFLRFFDERLYQIEIFYNKEDRPMDLTAFANNYSAKSSFPANLWKIKYGYATAKCVGFTLRADTILNPHIELTDENGLEKIAAAAKLKAQEKKESGN